MSKGDQRRSSGNGYPILTREERELLKVKVSKIQKRRMKFWDRVEREHYGVV